MARQISANAIKIRTTDSVEYYGNPVANNGNVFGVYQIPLRNRWGELQVQVRVRISYPINNLWETSEIVLDGKQYYSAQYNCPL